MTTDIVPYQTTSAAPTKWVDLVGPAASLAAQIANTDFVPAAMRGKPAAVAACILFGDELGLGPMQSLSKIDVIDGRPAPKAELARALVLGAGHELWFEENTSQRCTVVGKRRGTGREERVTWTMEDAKRAGLDGKQNWRKWPRAMLVARASAELCRNSFSDCLGGITLFAEEVDDDQAPTEQTTPAPLTAVAKPTARTRKLDKAAENPAAVALANELAAAPTAAPDLPPLPDEEAQWEALDGEAPAGDGALFDEINGTGPKMVSDAQLKKLATMFGKVSLATRDDRIKFCALVTGRSLVSSKDLTAVEASRVIERLTDVEEERAGFILDSEGNLAEIVEEVAA